MPTANARKGAETERMVAAYLRLQGFPQADRRLREGRADDQGDIDGVPHTVIQVKYVAQPRLQSWVEDTLKQRDAAGAPLCLLVVRVRQQPPQCWHAYMPIGQVYSEQIFGEGVAAGWTRMDLALAAALLRRKIGEIQASSLSSSRSTWTDLKPVITGPRAHFSAPSTEKDTPPSPTT